MILTICFSVLLAQPAAINKFVFLTESDCPDNAPYELSQEAALRQ